MIKMGKMEDAEEMEQVMIEEGHVCMRVLSVAYPISPGATAITGSYLLGS